MEKLRQITKDKFGLNFGVKDIKAQSDSGDYSDDDDNLQNA